MSGMQEALAYGAAGVLSLGVAAEAAQGQTEQTPVKELLPNPAQEVTQLAPTVLPQGAKISAVLGENGVFHFSPKEDVVASVSTTTPEPVTTTTIVSRNLVESAESVADKKVIIGESMNIRITRRPNRQPKCVWTKPGQEWTNSVRLANGKTKRYIEDTPAQLCREPNSRTGWVKRKGGKSGIDCRNEAKPAPMKNATRDVEVINISNLNTSFKLVAKAMLDKSIACPGVNGSGYVEGSVEQKFTFRNYLKKKGAAQHKINLELADAAKVKVGLNLHCDSTETTTTTTPPPPENPKFPPTVDVDNPNHIGTNMKIAFCEREGDVDGTIVQRTFKVEQGGGNFVTMPYPGNDKNEFCADYVGPAVANKLVVLSAEVTDNDGLTAKDSSEPFPSQEMPK